MSYQVRVLDSYLAGMLSALPAVAIDGPKAVGKTATASRLAGSRLDLDQESNVALLREDPSRLSRMARPVLIDEWQYYPPVWDMVRRAVDGSEGNGLFLLTGSATPARKPKHSGAGRIVHLRLRPFSLSERQLCEPTVSLSSLATGARDAIGGDSPLTVTDYAEEIVRGGFPRLRDTPPAYRRPAWDGYLAEVFNRELPESGRTVRRGGTLRNWLRAYAAATATTASYTEILDRAMPGDTDKPTKATALSWREILSEMWLLDPVPAWPDPNHRLGRLIESPKHHVADPALAAHLLGHTALTLLDAPSLADGSARAKTAFDALFESLVTLCVRVYAAPLGYAVSHLRTRNGDHEVDLLVTREDGKTVAFEVKSTVEVTNADVKHLRWLSDRLGADLLDAVVVTTGPAAYRRSSDGIAVVPAALLGP
jgi:predicted AAA+ superfamily ATPase